MKEKCITNILNESKPHPEIILIFFCYQYFTRKNWFCFQKLVWTWFLLGFLFKILVPHVFYPLKSQKHQLLMKKVLLLETNVYVTLRTINLFDIKPEFFSSLSLFFSLLLSLVVRVFSWSSSWNSTKTGIEESDVLQSRKKKNEAEMAEMLNILCVQ